MLALLQQHKHTQFHQGLERLGQCLGAVTLQTSEEGAPDVVWSLPADLHVAFEAKTEKTESGTLSKKDVQQAKGHVDWVAAKLAEGADAPTILSIIISPTSTMDAAAVPHAAGVFWMHPDSVRQIASRAEACLRELRTNYGTRQDFGAVVNEVSGEIKRSGLDLPALIAEVTNHKLDQSS